MEARADRLAVDEAFTAALSLMVRRHSRSVAGGRRLGRELAPIRRARLLVDANYMQDLTLDRLAGAAGLSRFYFLRAFRSEIGVTPHAYRSEEHTSELQSLMRISYAVFCLK